MDGYDELTYRYNSQMRFYHLEKKDNLNIYTGNPSNGF
jgi:hypothetical protein